MRTWPDGSIRLFGGKVFVALTREFGTAAEARGNFLL
jgi:hypothetical protein